MRDACVDVAAEALAQRGLCGRRQQIQPEIGSPDGVGFLDGEVPPSVEAYSRSGEGEGDEQSQQAEDGTVDSADPDEVHGLVAQSESTSNGQRPQERGEEPEQDDRKEERIHLTPGPPVMNGSRRASRDSPVVAEPDGGQEGTPADVDGGLYLEPPGDQLQPEGQMRTAGVEDAAAEIAQMLKIGATRRGRPGEGCLKPNWNGGDGPEVEVERDAQPEGLPVEVSCVPALFDERVGDIRSDAERSPGRPVHGQRRLHAVGVVRAEDASFSDNAAALPAGVGDALEPVGDGQR